MRAVPPLVLSFFLNAVWQVALVVAFAALCDWLLRGLAARYRHYVWTVTLVICLALPVLSSLDWIRPGTQPQQSFKENIGRPTVTSRILTPGVETAGSPAVERSRAPESETTVAPASSSAIYVNPKFALPLAVLYGLLLLWRSANFLRAWRRTRKIVKTAFECEFSESTKAIISDCQTIIGISGSRVLCSADVQVPATVGVIKRVIILPQRFAGKVDDDVLRSAIGHELVHIARRDYLMNLIYELVYIPLSFHPAAALARRRIKHTRELCCDETVAAKLIKPETYARSLISLIGSAPPWRSVAADTTIGINESDILEVRIMSLLKTRASSSRRRTLLLIASSLLLLMPCLAAARFTPRFEINPQEPKRELQERKEAERRVLEKVTELRQQERALREKLQQASEPQRSAIELKMREIQENLEIHMRAVEAYKKNLENEDARQLKQVLEELEKSKSADEAKLEAKLRQQIAEAEKTSAPEKLIEELKARIEEAQRLDAKDRKARLVYHVEPAYSPDAREKKIEGSVILRFTVNHDGIPEAIQVTRPLYPSLDQAAVEAVRTWRFEPAKKNGEIVSMWVESEVSFRLNDGQQSPEEREREKEARAQELRRITSVNAQREQAQRRNPAELARHAKISMEQAIQIATSKVPGKVIGVILEGQNWVGTGESAKPSLVLYCVTILSGDESHPETNFVMVNAFDGSIFSAEKYEQRKRSENLFDGGRNIEGGVLNGKAISLPAPTYSSIARAAHAEGNVVVRVIIDEGGNIIAANAVSGHPLLRAAAVSAAREAKFTPTRLEGRPVQVRGSLVYNFVKQ